MGIVSSIKFTIIDFLYLLQTPIAARKKWHIFVTYVKLSVLVFVAPKKKEVTLFGRKTRFPDLKTFAFLYRELFVKQTYYCETNAIAPKIIDCGANIGISVRYFQWLFQGAAEIHAFEPLGINVHYLQKNVPEVKIHPVAVGEKKGKMKFYFVEEKLELLTSSIYEERGGKASCTVHVERLANLVWKLKQVDVLKIDVEGAEHGVFRDLLRHNCLRKIKTLMIEYHHNIGNGESLASFLAMLEKEKYSYRIDGMLNSHNTVVAQDVMIYAERIA